MTRIITIFFLALCSISSVKLSAQLSAPTASSTQMTNYTNGMPPDPIYIFCTPNYFGVPVPTQLTATAPGGQSGCTFNWFSYNQGINAWVVHSTQTNASSSTLTGIPSGGYRCVIKASNGTVLGCYRAWVWLKQTTLDINPIPPGCEPFTITGVHNTNNSFTYYNPPPDPFIIDQNTIITVCMSANHTYVSDLGFFLVSPCGATIPLAPHPQAINAANGCCCNGGNNVNGLCFSTQNSNMLNVCGGGAPLGGSFGIYGQGSPGNYGANNNNWSPLYGCDATLGGWAVQIYDCIGADVGALTNATISFNGNASCGPSSISYNSGNINSVINDNSCTPQSASIYTVPPPPPTVAQTLTATTTYSWTASAGGVAFTPNVAFPQVIDPAPEEDTWFYLTVTSSVGCVNIDSVFFDYTPVDTPIIAPPPVFCFNGPGDTLSVDIENGTWSGVGITDTITGFFDPVVAGPGVHQVIYLGEQPCGNADTVMVTVSDEITFNTQIDNSSCFQADDGLIFVNVLTGYMPVTGTWDTSPVQNSLTATNLPPGTHTLILQDGYGCRDTSQHITTEPTLLQVQTAKVDVNCIGGSNGQASATPNGGTMPYNYSWSSVPVQQTQQATNLQAGNYTVTVTDDNGCQVQATVTLNTLSTPPNVQPNITDESCPDVSDGSIDISVSAGAPPFTYAWNNNETTEDIDSVTAGNYSVTLTDMYQCPYNHNFVVISGNALDFSYAVTNVLCFQENTGVIAVTPLSGNPPYNFYVNGSNAGTSGHLGNLYAGYYTVQIVDSRGCDSSFATSISQPPTMYSDSTYHQISLGNYTTLNPAYGGGTGDLALNWYPFYNLSCMDCPNPMAWPDITTDYTLTITDANGCIEYSEVVVDVMHDGPFIPNTFTPGKDELNNVWKVSDYGVKDFSAMIFDRWGNKIYESDNIYEGWDGKLKNGNYYENSVYAYKVYIRYIDGKEKTLLGNVTLLR